MLTYTLVRLAPRNTSMPLLILACLLTLTQGCGSSNEVKIKAGGDSCPLPPSLADEAKDEIKKFSGEVSGLIKAVAGVSASGDIQNTVEKHYPDSHDVNRIYALSYTACVSCRLDPTDVKGCAQRFSDIINANHAKREAAAQTAEAYHKQVLDPLKGTAGGK